MYNILNNAIIEGNKYYYAFGIAFLEQCKESRDWANADDWEQALVDDINTNPADYFVEFVLFISS